MHLYAPVWRITERHTRSPSLMPSANTLTLRRSIDNRRPWYKDCSHGISSMSRSGQHDHFQNVDHGRYFRERVKNCRCHSWSDRTERVDSTQLNTHSPCTWRQQAGRRLRVPNVLRSSIPRIVHSAPYGQRTYTRRIGLLGINTGTDQRRRWAVDFVCLGRLCLPYPTSAPGYPFSVNELSKTANSGSCNES